MVYESLTGRKYTVDRFFNLEYQTLECQREIKNGLIKSNC
jgi:hypothetical protein